MALALRKAGSPPPPAGRPPFSWDCTQAAPLPATLFGSARGPMVRSPVPFTRPRPQWPPVGMSASAKCRSPLLPSWGPCAPQGLGLEHGGSGLGPGRGACAGKAGGAASRLVSAWSLGGPRGSGQQCFLRGGPGAASVSARAPAVSAWGGGAQSRSSPSPGAACCVSLVTRRDSAKRCRASQQRPLPAAGHVESDPWQWREDKWREECATAWDPAAQSPGLSHLVLTAARRAGGAAACFPEAGGGGSQRVTSPYHMAGSSRRPRSSGEGATLSLSHPTPWGVLLVPGNFAIETRNASILSFMHSKNMKSFISN